MTYRDEREALRERLVAAEQELVALRRDAGRATALERRVRELEARLGDKRRSPAMPWVPPRSGARALVVVVGVAAVVSIALWFRASAPPATAATRPKRPTPAPTVPSPPEHVPLDPFQITLSRAPLVADVNGDGVGDIVAWGTCAHGKERGSFALRAYDGASGATIWTHCGVFSAQDFDERHLALVGNVILATVGRSWSGLRPSDGMARWSGTAPAWILGFGCEGERSTEILLDGGARPLSIDTGSGRASESTHANEPKTACHLPLHQSDWSVSNDEAVVVDGSSRTDLGTVPSIEGFGPALAAPVHEGMLVLGERNTSWPVPTVALIERGGALVWKTELDPETKREPDGGPPSRALVARGHVFVLHRPTAASEPRVSSLDARTGAVAWSSSVANGKRDAGIVGLASSDRALYVLSPLGLQALAIDTGAPLFALR